MSIWKTSTQVANAALGSYKISLMKNKDIVMNWEYMSGQAKIVFGVDNEQ